MVDGFSLVCPACGQGADLSAGLTPNENGQLICANCGAEIPVPLAAPDDSLGDTTTSAADLPTVVDPQHQVHPAGADSIESVLPNSHYVEGETIGKGGMGEIVLCVEQNTRREVAMKRMLPTAAGHAKHRARFVEEAQVTAQLEHPNIVPIHELGRDEQGAIYFTMKLVKGRSLAEILRGARDGEESHSLGELLQIFLKVCDGVAFAHSRGVVHRDLKPANIMVGDFGEVLVMDWGIARILGREEDAGDTGVQSNRQDTNLPALHTMDGTAMGSPSYMPPEQAAGEIDKIDHRSDIYSLGAILYEILTLKRPFEGKTARAIMDTVIAGDIQTPEQRSPRRDIPRELSAVAMKCLAKYRPKRYASVPDLQRDISLYLEGRSVSAAPDTFAQALVKLVKRNKGISVSIAAAAVILIALGTVFVIGLKAERDVAVTERQAAQDARDKQRATALAASESLAGQAVRAAEQGRFAEADVRADTAMKVMPDGPWGHYALGVVAFDKKDFTTARKHLDQALGLDADHNPSKVYLSRVLAVSGDLARAEALVTRADATDDWRLLIAAGDALVSAQRYVRGIKAYEASLKLMAPDDTTLPKHLSETRDKLSRAKIGLEFDGFRESIRLLPATEQAQRLEAKLKEVYGSDIKIGFTIEKGSIMRVSVGGKTIRWLDPFRGMQLTSFKCGRTSVSDLGPLRGMPLKELRCGFTKIRDLAPLKGMPLQSLTISDTRVSDLSPLKGMPLTYLDCNRTAVSDLGPLKGMPLRNLRCGGTRVQDLSSLKGMPLTIMDLGQCSALTSLKGIEGLKLTVLNLAQCSALTSLKGIEGMSLKSLKCGSTNIRELDILKGMPLTVLDCKNAPVQDLSPLKGMLLIELNIHSTRVSDLSPLEGMKLEVFCFVPKNITKGIEIIRGMKSFRGIGCERKDVMKPEEFWKKYDAGDYDQ